MKIKMSHTHQEKGDPEKKIWAWQYDAEETGAIPMWFYFAGFRFFDLSTDDTYVYVISKNKFVNGLSETNELNYPGIPLCPGDWFVLFEKEVLLPGMMIARNLIFPTVISDEEFEERYEHV